MPTCAATGAGAAFRSSELPVVLTTGEQVATLTAPGNAAHDLLGWILLALIAGHIAMAFYHTMVWKVGTLERMRPV